MPRPSVEPSATFGLMLGGAIAGAALGSAMPFITLGLLGAMARLAVTHREPAHALTGVRARSIRAPK